MCPVNKKLYPENWDSEIRPRVLERAGNCCEICKVPNYQIVFRGTTDIKDGDQVKKIEIYQYATGEIFDSETGEYIATDFYADIEPLSGDPNQVAIKIVLTISHQNHDVSDNRMENLKALCQLHHNRHDAQYRANNRKRRQWQLEMF